MRSTLVAVASTLGLVSGVACDLGKTPIGGFEGSSGTETDGGSSSGGTDSPTTADASGGADGSTTDSTAGPTGEPACGERSACSIPFACNAGWMCGELNSSFDADGCPRPSCTNDEDCQPDEVCHDPAKWGSCNGVAGCADEPELGICDCFVQLNCDGTDYCMPRDGVVDAGDGDSYCAQFLDATSCDAALSGFADGRCGFVAGLEGSTEAVCEELVAIERCVFLRPRVGPPPEELLCAGTDEIPMVRAIGASQSILRIPGEWRPGAMEDGAWEVCYGLPDTTACDCVCGG